MQRTEFYESAVKYGFYGVDKSGLFGKKDNVRKYWEDVAIKVSIRPAIERILEHKNKVRIVDLGCGSGARVIPRAQKRMGAIAPRRSIIRPYSPKKPTTASRKS